MDLQKDVFKIIAEKEINSQKVDAS